MAMQDQPVPVLDEATGREASRALLRKCLAYAPPAFLAGAVTGHSHLQLQFLVPQDFLHQPLEKAEFRPAASHHTESFLLH